MHENLETYEEKEEKLSPTNRAVSLNSLHLFGNHFRLATRDLEPTWPAIRKQVKTELFRRAYTMLRNAPCGSYRRREQLDGGCRTSGGKSAEAACRSFALHTRKSKVSVDVDIQ